MKRSFNLSLAFLLALALMLTQVSMARAVPALASAGATTRVSVSSSGTEGNGGSGYAPSMSADGRYVAFMSAASNLVSGDTNAAVDIFVRDTQTNTTTRVSLDSSGAQGNGHSYGPSISGDGRYVAFYSDASNLVSGDTNGASDIFVRDTQMNTTTRISVDSGGAQANNWSFWPSISADGRYVAFMSDASNLVSGVVYCGVSNIFVRDTQTGTTTCVSVALSSAYPGGGFNPVISADGRYVAFSSKASNLVNGDTNGKEDVFVRDTQTNTTTRVSISSSGAQGNADSSYPTAITADGRYVVFVSDASNLVSGDTNGVRDIFMRDTVENITTRISVDSSGAQANGSSWPGHISADGRYVAFSSDASNLVGGDTNAATDIFVRDTQFISDTSAPTVDTFTAPLFSASPNIPITAFTASDNTGVAGYLITASSGVPAADAAGWSLTPPTSYTVPSDGSYSLYPWAKDAAGNVSSVFASPAQVLVDTTAPGVLSSARANPNPTHAASVDFTVTFSEPVTGVDLVGPVFADFSLAPGAGLSGAAVTGVSGSGAVYTVTVDTGTGNGTLRLDVLTGGGIQDGTGNPLASGFTAGEVYDVVKSVNISGSAGVAGVTLSYNDGAPRTTLSAADGSYSLTVPYGWAGTLTPFRAAYTFAPPSQSYAATPVTADLTGQDFSAISHVLDDFNGDGKTEPSVFRKSTGYWYIHYADGTSSIKQWGNNAAGDITQLGDYNGDGLGDYAVWRKSTGVWYIKYADDTTYSQQWGNLANGDIPVPGDYNGDGVTDIAVWRPTNGTWYVHYMDGTTTSQQWGNNAAGDVPVPADYNGDGVTEFAVFRKSTGYWYIRYADGTSQARQWGNAAAGDIPMPGDYNGDGKTELAVWRQSTGFWYVKYADDTSSSQQWGNYASGDMPVSGDFNGDGKTDYAVWRPSNGTWYIKYADGTSYTQQWGNLAAGDLPLPRR